MGAGKLQDFSIFSQCLGNVLGCPGFPDPLFRCFSDEEEERFLGHMCGDF